MKRILISSIALLALSACGAPSTSGSAGSSSSPTVTTVSAPVSGNEGRSPGFYKTRGGVPWMVYRSRARERGRGALPQQLAVREAGTRGPFKASNTVTIENNGSTAMFQVVTVDGHTFGVAKRLNTPGLYATPETRAKASAGILLKGLRIAGCQQAGPTGDLWKGHNVHIAGIVPAVC